ncbi:MAG: SRPBCC family protein [Acidobacteriota bacterium]|nr:SRPBCC family protein [Acidobacteriota bacterium]
MFAIRDTVRISAPVGRCFALSCSLAVVERELRMHPVAGVDPETGAPYRTAGLVVGGDRVRWQGWKFGLPQVHVSLISRFEPGRFFRDTMIGGRFRTFEHDHSFREDAGGTVLDDAIRFSLPFGAAGWLVGRVLMRPYIRGLLARRFRLLKELAEGDGWQEYLGGGVRCEGRRAGLR